MRNLLILILAFCTLTLSARSKKPPLPVQPSKVALTPEFRYRLTLRDKAESPYSIDRPEEFLSPKSIERRRRFGLTVDEHDLPVSPSYLRQIRATGARVFNVSKWNNTVQVTLPDTTDGTLSRLRALPCVESSLLVYVAPDSIDYEIEEPRQSILENKRPHTTAPDSIYGVSQRQVDQLNLPNLHSLGYRGESMTIAVIDGGFYNADLITAFDHSRILGTRNIAFPGVDVYSQHPHGMMVLSCMAPDIPGTIIGTAPAASYYLIQSEDTRFEYRGEEDNWCAAIEYADSLGVDVVTSSLGYVYFEAPAAKLQYHWLDGRHELNSRSASLAASRGILLCNSAGNEGDNEWKKIGFPADASNILTVGAVDDEGVNTIFSSVGYTADHRIKPDCMAMGGHTALLSPAGNTSHANGTSFSCPVMAGAVTCLMQACPAASPIDIIDAIHRACNNSMHPNEIYGYGIPDILKAYEILKSDEVLKN